MFDYTVRNFHLRRKIPIQNFSERDAIRLVGKPPVFIVTADLPPKEHSRLEPRGYVSGWRRNGTEYFADFSALDRPDSIALCYAQKIGDYSTQIFHDGLGRLSYVLLTSESFIPDVFEMKKKFGEDALEIERLRRVLSFARLHNCSFEVALDAVGSEK